MKDKELAQMLRCCGTDDENADCSHCAASDYGCEGAFLRAADRLEALIAENEHLREVTKMVHGASMAHTTADNIRSMSDFELMEFLWKLDSADLGEVIKFCGKSHVCDELDVDEITDEMCKQCLLAKLLRPYESPTGQKG